MTEEARTEIRGPIGIVFYSNPDGTFIGNRGAAALQRGISELLANPQIRAIILTGATPGGFIRHANVDLITRAGDALAAKKIEPASFATSPFFQLMETLDGATKPVIAAIDGPCMGGGLEIALACTLRIVSASVELVGLPEIRINILPGSGGTQRIARVMTPHAARRFVLLGLVVDAAEAGQLGIVDEVVPDALSRALEVANSISSRSAEAVSAIMELMRPEPNERLMDEALAFARVVREPAALDRMRDFLAKREWLHEVP